MEASTFMDSQHELEASLAIVREALGDLYDHAEPFLEGRPADDMDVLTRHPDGDLAQSQAAALEALATIPDEHLVTATRRAVAERNNDGIDYLPQPVQRRIIFTEGFLLSLMSEADRARILGVTIELPAAATEPTAPLRPQLLEDVHGSREDPRETGPPDDRKANER